MTLIEMQHLLESPAPKVRELAEQYGALWDAAQDLCTMLDTEDYDLDIEFTPTGDAYHKLLLVLCSQPNVEKTP